jgi:hypothetical protein
MQDSNHKTNPLTSLTPINTMNTMQPSDFSTISYRLDGLEKQLTLLQGQLHQYVPVRENELQLRSIQDTVRDTRDDVAEIRKQISDMSQKMIEQEKAARERDNQQRESQDKLQIRVLWFIVSSVVVLLSGVLVGFLTHLIQ